MMPDEPPRQKVLFATTDPVADVMGTIRGIFADVLPAEQLDLLERDIAVQWSRLSGREMDLFPTDGEEPEDDESDQH